MLIAWRNGLMQRALRSGSTTTSTTVRRGEETTGRSIDWQRVGLTQEQIDAQCQRAVGRSDLLGEFIEGWHSGSAMPREE
jgi:hypothetical protein